MNRVDHTNHSWRMLATPPHGLLLAYSLVWLAVAIGLAVRAIASGSVISGIESTGFLVVALLLWARSRASLVANLVLGLFLITVGISVVFAVGEWGTLLSGVLMLACHWAFREELEGQSGADGLRRTNDYLPSHGPGLCLALLRDGWKCHRFPHSDVVVALPHDFVAGFDTEGVLLGTIDGNSHNFSATLHCDEAFQIDPRSPYAFLDHLARQSAAEPADKGTYRYFKDPNPRVDEQLEYTFYVIAIPRAIVVLSIASTAGQDRPASLARIEDAIPDIVGELT